jgi:hypothetical protein
MKYRPEFDFIGHVPAEQRAVMEGQDEDDRFFAIGVRRSKARFLTERSWPGQESPSNPMSSVAAVTFIVAVCRKPHHCRLQALPVCEVIIAMPAWTFDVGGKLFMQVKV